ncbi:MAG: HD domain-containing protein [Lachnospiraceae bacterium]|nr:HD domain-containing protein [Lachnospiraceae bacterium]
MDTEVRSAKHISLKRSTRIVILCLIGVALNLLGDLLVRMMSIPLFLDSAGTILASVIGGYLPGVAVGFLTNIIKMIWDSASVYYGSLNVIIALIAALFARKGWLKKIPGMLGLVLVLPFVGGFLGSILTWFLYGFAGEGISVSFVRRLYESGSISPFFAQIIADFLIDLADKLVTVIFVMLVVKIMPEKLIDKLRFDGWQQKPLTGDTLKKALGIKVRRFSMKMKIPFVLALTLLLVGIAGTGIAYMTYRNSMIEEHENMGIGFSDLVAEAVDSGKVELYLSQGERALGYRETEKLLSSIRDCYPDIEYAYVYKIMEDGCHVVFDLDTDGVEGAEPGTVIPFDESFEPLVPALLAGQPIDPIVSNDTYGWLMSVYTPVYNSFGECVCYGCVDLSMESMTTAGYAFLAKQISLLAGFFLLILSAGIWMAQYNIVFPVNSISMVSEDFANSGGEEMRAIVEHIKTMDIHTGDEIEKLYMTFVQMTQNTVNYFDDIQNKADLIEQMQNALVFVLADMVEGRDQNTGQHVRKTAAYTKIILEELRKEGVYTDVLTDEYISSVVNSAPLHDIGKISVPDAVLNKPGKLDDNEFEIMKSHTTKGKEIIEKAIETVPESGYLSEARLLAAYHHEKWNGKGYPTGLEGENIPLCARVMAVADVFDALVSKRSYKEGFPFDKAMDIIKEGSGTHFDPKVVTAFVNLSDKVKEIADSFS